MKRTQITAQQLDNAMETLRNKLVSRLEEKGYGTLASRHESLGVIEEEYIELIDAVTEDGPLGGEVRHELIDLAVACVFSVACIDAGTMDW